MDIDDPHALALLIVGRGIEKSPDQACADQQNRRRRAPGLQGGGQTQETGGIGKTVPDRGYI